jgi:hypothetical protein
MIAVRPRPRVMRARAQSFALPAPVGGDDTVSPATAIAPGHSIYSYNVIGGVLGLQSRLGWREWCTGLDGQVRSLLPYTGSTKDGASNRLFACTETGIWDVSASSSTPTQVVTFPTQNTDSGWGVSTVFVTGGGHFLAYTDEANGYYVYTESGATWTKVAQGAGGTEIDGVDPAHFVSVCAWKNRLWFVERDTARAWYLPLNSIYGTAAAFTFGARFKAGGDLRGLWSWTGDAGAGIDDRLVAVSGAGDVVIYEGTDPSSASTFALRGVWFVGAVPVGRRLCTDSGGDLLIMSSMGILPISRLVTSGSDEQGQYQTYRVANVYKELQGATSTLRGWAMRLHPQDAALMVLYPVASGQPTQQLVMSLTTKGWHRYRDMPIGACAEAWAGTLYFGTEDGRVCRNDGALDGVLLADPNSYTAIDWSLLSAYSNAGSPTRKRVQQIRVKVLSQGGSIALNAEARYDLDLTEAAVPSEASSVSDVAVWDEGLWDEAVWGGDSQPQIQTFGAAGDGHDVAIAIRGRATSRMTLVGVDATYDSGGWA